MTESVLCSIARSTIILNNTDEDKWAETWVELRMSFWRQHCKGLVFTTEIGVEFFDIIWECVTHNTPYKGNDKAMKEFILSLIDTTIGPVTPKQHKCISELFNQNSNE